MAKIRFLLLLFVCGIIAGAAQQHELKPAVVAEAPPVLEPEVTFLAQAPQIDGILDSQLSALPVRNFNYCYKLGPKNLDIPVHYRLAYGTEFFYVCIEVETDEIIYRDRGYQNGDGFGLVLAVPRPESKPTDEFYVLGFSATDSPASQWARKIVWYFNVDISFLKLSDETKFEVQARDKKVTFELLLPWKEVYPYHSWISEAIGFNLWFVKAVGESQANYHIVVNDQNVGSEQQKRIYTLLKFQNPALETGHQSFLVLDKNHCRQGDVVRARIASLSGASGKEKVLVSINSTEGTRIGSETFDFNYPKGLKIEERILKTSGLPPGSYKIQWSSLSHDFKGETGLTVLPQFDFASMNDFLLKIRGKVSEGTLTTLQFQLQDFEKTLKQLKPYQTCASLSAEISEFSELLKKAENGEDVLAAKTGISRRAFRSRIDNTLQPYSVKIPANFDRGKKYPLLVFLHGSARDDRDIQTHDYASTDEFIELAPCARGTSNCFSTDNAQEDIREAIEDACKNYPIDKDNIILAGFSMGGYGVYRTFYQSPGRFRALAVFSGQPDMANLWRIPGGPHPNFLEDKCLAPFKDIPIFIFHGKKDRNCPFELAAQLVEKLKAAGARVEFHMEEEAGHSRPGENTIKLYHEWLENI